MLHLTMATALPRVNLNEQVYETLRQRVLRRDPGPGAKLSLHELATELGLSKPTMKHHLAQMRAAGLVTITEEGSLTYYSLRRERLKDAGLELIRFVG